MRAREPTATNEDLTEPRRKPLAVPRQDRRAWGVEPPRQRHALSRWRWL